MSRLQPIQVTAQQIAEAISSVLKMDVTIVDEQMVRIAGTGAHQATIGQQIVGHSVYQQVLRSKAEYIISDVSSSHACEGCERQATCLELAQLCCPIVLGTETVGVIGLIAFSRSQQAQLADAGEQLLAFLRKMAELLAAKVVEKEALNRVMLLKNQLETVLHFVTEGIVAIDHLARIINLNLAAEKMLRVKAADVLGFHINEVFPGTPISEVLQSGQAFVDREVKVWHNGRQHHYWINAKPMLADGSVGGVVASFRPVTAAAPAAALQQGLPLEAILGESAALRQSKEAVRQAAAGTSTVLITGESGTGKELFARAIHGESERRKGPFVAVNCAAIPENLLESELFGYEEGSFTGARKGGKPGKFQLAHGGTLFLDEIGDMPLALQAKMLRVLQEKVVERVGGLQPIPIEVRIIAATHRNLEELVQAGAFREDLYYRLHVFVLELPPLRVRREDIAFLARHFLTKHAAAYGKETPQLGSDALARLTAYDWPGNVRELENAMECAVVRLQNSQLTAADLPAKIAQADQVGQDERERLRQALLDFGTDVAGKKQAAASLGMSMATLYRKLRKYNLAGLE